MVAPINYLSVLLEGLDHQDMLLTVLQLGKSVRLALPNLALLLLIRCYVR